MQQPTRRTDMAILRFHDASVCDLVLVPLLLLDFLNNSIHGRPVRGVGHDSFVPFGIGLRQLIE